jgi:hypothetical protein
MNNDLAKLPADDLDGSVSATVSTVSFEIDHVSYEINLTAENAAALRTRLAAFIAHARPVPAPQIYVPAPAD